MQLQTLAERYDDRLDLDAYAEVDASANGIQVAGPETIEHAAFAVDAAQETIDAAAAAGVDVLVVHHGLIWGGLDRITDRAYDRIASLIKNNIALYVAHLPLDGHPDLGNAAGLCDLLGLEDRSPFGHLGAESIGLQGRVAGEPLTTERLRVDLERALATGGQGVQIIPGGDDEIQDVAVVTGSGADWLDEAAELGVDAFITGEGKGKLYHEAREAGITVYLAGHYATETFGVRRLQALAEDWGLETTFIEAPTGL